MVSPSSPSRGGQASPHVKAKVKAAAAAAQAAVKDKGSTISTADVCQELDHFEATAEVMPRISNFYGTPRASRGGPARRYPDERQALPSFESSSQEGDTGF